MNFDLSSLDVKTRYKLLLSSVLPRPIALVTSMNTKGVVNAAPFSLFNLMAATPPTVVIGIDSHEIGVHKDTVKNIHEISEFTINLVNENMADRMNLCSTRLPSDQSEVEYARFDLLPSVQIKPPRISEAPISLECKRVVALDIGNGRTIIVGDILHYHIQDEYFDSERKYVLVEEMGLIARMHGKGWYLRTSDLFQIQRPDPMENI